VAQTATVYTATIDLADMDRNVYETLDLRVARHPSETAEYMLVRILAYCLEYQEGIALTEGVSSGSEPALVVRDLTGRITGWIEVGMPDAERLHRGSKLAGRVAVYTHRDVRQLMGNLNGQHIHRSEDIPIRAFDRTLVEEIAAHLDRRISMSLSVTGGELFLALGDGSWTLPLVEHRLSS
jgi:uncharacterized protein YaeQ